MIDPDIPLIIGQFSKKKMVTIDLDDTIREAIQKMCENNIRHLPVMKDGTLMGIVMIYDVLNVLNNASDISILDEKIERFYSDKITVLDHEEPLGDAIVKLARIDTDCILITEDKRLCGIFTEIDILNTDYLWTNINDESIHSGKDLGEDITEINCLSEDATISQAIQLMSHLKYEFIGVIEPDTKILKGELSSLNILRHIYLEINYSDKFNIFKNVPIFKVTLDQTYFFEEPSTLSTIRSELYMYDINVATMLDKNNYPIKMISVNHIIEHFVENCTIINLAEFQRKGEINA